jgi:hypothetical protein
LLAKQKQSKPEKSKNLQIKYIIPGSPSDRICRGCNKGKTFKRRKPSFAVSSVLGLAKVHFKLDISGAENQAFKTSMTISVIQTIPTN